VYIDGDGPMAVLRYTGELEPLAYLAEHAIRERWSVLRDRLASQCRVTATFRRADGRTLHVGKATRAEPDQAAIYSALNVNPAPGGVQKTII
jgi:hypothetical protein